MARGKLFESWTFKLTLPEPFDDPKYSGMHDTGLSRYNCAGRLRKATLHAPSLRALLAYANLVLASEKGQNTDGLGAIGHQDKNFRIAEYHSANKTDCVVFNPNTGKFIASQFEDGSDTPKAYTVGPGNGSGSALFFCLMPVLEQEEEFQDNFAVFKDNYLCGLILCRVTDHGVPLGDTAAVFCLRHCADYSTSRAKCDTSHNRPPQTALHVLPHFGIRVHSCRNSSICRDTVGACIRLYHYRFPMDNHLTGDT